MLSLFTQELRLRMPSTTPPPVTPPTTSVIQLHPICIYICANSIIINNHLPTATFLIKAARELFPSPEAETQQASGLGVGSYSNHMSYHHAIISNIYDATMNGQASDEELRRSMTAPSTAETTPAESPKACQLRVLYTCGLFMPFVIYIAPCFDATVNYIGE